MPPLSQVITIDWKDIVYCTVLLYLWRFGSTLFGIQRSTDVIFPCVPCNVKYCVSAPEADGVQNLNVASAILFCFSPPAITGSALSMSPTHLTSPTLPSESNAHSSELISIEF